MKGTGVCRVRYSEGFMSLSLIYYRVNELEFKFNEAVKPNTSFQIKPKIECKVAKKEETLYVNLTLKINEDISIGSPSGATLRT